MKEFSKPQYNVNVLKVEVPVDMKFVEGYTEGDTAYIKEEAAVYFKEQSEATGGLPLIFLNAGVSADLFQRHLNLSKNPAPPSTVSSAAAQPGKMAPLYSPKTVSKQAAPGFKTQKRRTFRIK
jgi:tagatose-1,6-bisphosphate aldolase